MLVGISCGRWFMPVIRCIRRARPFTGRINAGMVSRYFSAKVTGEATLIDMNGNVVKQWKGISGFPARILPGGYLMGYIGTRPMHQDSTALVQADWNDNIVWKFDQS